MDNVRLLDRWTSDFLLEAGPRALGEGLERHRPAGLGRAIERADHAHVGEALVAARLGRAVLQDAVGEVEEFRRELVALREAPLAHLAIDGQAVLERLRVVVGGLEREIAL